MMENINYINKTIKICNITKYIIFGIIVLLTSISNGWSKDNNIRIYIDNIKLNQSYEKNKSSYSVRINIQNTTKSTFSFWIMSCSWQEIWISNNIKFDLEREYICDQNFPVERVIKPNQKIIYDEVIVLKHTNAVKRLDNCKLGFYYFTNENEMFDFLDKKKIILFPMREIIWSDPFKL